MRIGIDIGGMSVKIGVVDEDGRILSRVKLPMRAEAGFEHAVKAMADGAAEAAALADTTLDRIDMVGAGAPGCVDASDGSVIFANNLFWHNVPLREALQRCFAAPVYVGNDADCALIGESTAGAAVGADSALLVTLGTGVGGALMLGGRILTGGDGKGCEVGHMQLVFEGERCNCGLHGCYEAYASVTALTHQTEAALKAHPESRMGDYLKNGVVSGRTAFDAAADGDAVAIAVKERYCRYVAAGIGSLINVFRPKLVLIGGGISERGEQLIEPVSRFARDYVFAHEALSMPPIRAASLQNDAGLIGAAFLDKQQ